MDHWNKATEKLYLPKCQTSTAGKFEAFTITYLLLHINDQVCIES